MKKKIVFQSLIFIMIIMLIMLMTSCTQAEPLPVKEIEELEITADAKLGESTHISAYYDQSLWEFYPDLSETATFYLLKTGSLDGQGTNINFAMPDDLGANVSTQDMAQIVINTIKDGVGSKVVYEEIRKLPNREFVYLESEFEYTDETIEKMTELGLLTQEVIDALGGVEELKKLPTTYQINTAVNIDGLVYGFSGTYFESDEKEMVENALTLIIQTAQPK